ncbi:MAG TPA: hypothetical protein EYG72_01180 [Candidatus Pacebacteria bacterium]|nr:hypothetical protein [Candidatus Paceibacterota bacterium]
MSEVTPRIIAIKESFTGEVYQTSKWESPTFRKALESAVSAFSKRAVAKLSQQEVDDVVGPDKGVLVFLQDSYAVGNCQSGTEAWIRDNGVTEKVAPLWKIHEAAEKSDNNLARNVVKAVAAEYLSAQKKEVA